MNEKKGTARRKFWGWGFEGQGFGQEERTAMAARIAQRYQTDDLDPGPPPPEVSEIELRAPRVAAPTSLAKISTAEPYERLLHSYGRSFPDAVRAFQRHYPEPPDIVAYPESEEHVGNVLDWASDANVAVVPFGGGSSVCGGVETAVSGSYAGVLSLDLTKMDRVLEVDPTSRAARIQGGARGPVFEAQLKEHGYSMRHFPQSFEMATLGGMIATRSGGHFATLYTHIDDFVESLRCVTPAGILETRRLPGSGAGPSPDRLLIGSEGILGVITEAWMRVQDRPTHRAAASVFFGDFYQGAEAVRALSQAGLYPSNCRLIDSQEALSTGAGDGSASLLVLAFESADHPVDAWMARALELAQDHGGRLSEPDEDGPSHRAGAAGSWRNAFLSAPYWREVLVPIGVISDTFETSIPWNRFPDFHRTVSQRMKKVISEVTGRPASVTCRFTHAYPDGPAPYFTFQGFAGSLDRALEQWQEIKLAANQVVVEEGGTVTHHHAVGRDHRPEGYDQQRPELFANALRASKAVLDRNAILNPGVLIDPA